MANFYIEREINAPRDILWKVITDHQLYGEAASNLSKVEVVKGDGEGMHRRCYNEKGEGWNETCILWQEGHIYSFDVDTSDYPYPLSKMQGTWGIKKDGDKHKAYLRFDYEVKYGFIGKIMLNMFANEKVWTDICNGILDRWEERALALATVNQNEKEAGHA